MIINFLYLANQLAIKCQSEKEQIKKAKPNMHYNLLFSALWWIHFVLIFQARFISKPGAICSGDYSDMKSMDTIGMFMPSQLLAKQYGLGSGDDVTDFFTTGLNKPINFINKDENL